MTPQSAEAKANQKDQHMVAMRTRPNFAQDATIDRILMERLLSYRYYTHRENWNQLPGLNADLASGTEAVREPVSNNWEILGTNATSALATFAAGGGLTMTTAGADGDQMILATHLDTKQTALTQANWNSARSMLCSFVLVAGASVANAKIWAGWKLTNTPVTATDDDQAFFRYEDDVNSGKWQAITSIGGVDTATDTGVAGAASTPVRFTIEFNAERKASLWFNETEIIQSAAMTSLTTFEFYAGVMADGAAAAKAITVRPNLLLSQLLG